MGATLGRAERDSLPAAFAVELWTSATLAALSHALGKQLTVGPPMTPDHASGLLPAVVDRRLEARLVDVLRSRSTCMESWRDLGPPFFLAGLAVTVASVPGF